MSQRLRNPAASCHAGGVLAISLALIQVTSAIPSHAQEHAARVISYNIRYLNTTDGEDIWKNRREAVIQTISLADIVGLQEVVAAQMEDIRAGTGELEWYGVGRDDGRQAGEMTPIGWRTKVFAAEDRGTFWLSDTPEEKGSRGWDAALPRIASWVRLRHRASDRQLLVVNTHFDHRGREARRNSAKLIRTWIANHRGDMPAVLTGDFNATASDAPLRVLFEEDQQAGTALRDARGLSPTEDPGPDSTWNGFRAIDAGRRIDYVLLAGRLKVTHFETLNPKTAAGRFASDHLPVSVQMDLAAED